MGREVEGTTYINSILRIRNPILVCREGFGKLVCGFVVCWHCCLGYWGEGMHAVGRKVCMEGSGVGDSDGDVRSDGV